MFCDSQELQKKKMEIMMMIYVQKSCIQVHLMKHFNSLLRYYSKYVCSEAYSYHVPPEHKRLLASFTSPQHLE